MTMHDHSEWTDQLSDYADGELTGEQRHAVAAHLASCQECAGTLDQLRAVADRARSLPAMPPAADLWRDISRRITSDEDRRPIGGDFATRKRLSFTWPELVAASVLLVLLSGWAALRMTNHAPASAGLSPRDASGTAEPPSAAGQGRSGSAPDVALASVSVNDKEYDAAVADLQRALQSGRGQLDPATIKIVEDNLAIIDQAVDDARRALAADPSNADLSGYLLETRRRKLDLLRHAAALTDDLN